MVVHPAPEIIRYPGKCSVYHCNHLSGINGKIRPGIVHRLDKDTSGIIVVAKNDSAHRYLAAQIAARSLRVYWAIVENNIIEDEGTIDAPIKTSVDRKR